MYLSEATGHTRPSRYVHCSTPMTTITPFLQNLFD